MALVPALMVLEFRRRMVAQTRSALGPCHVFGVKLIALAEMPDVQGAAVGAVLSLGRLGPRCCGTCILFCNVYSSRLGSASPCRPRGPWSRCVLGPGRGPAFLQFWPPRPAFGGPHLSFLAGLLAASLVQCRSLVFRQGLNQTDKMTLCQLVLSCSFFPFIFISDSNCWPHG